MHPLCPRGRRGWAELDSGSQQAIFVQNRMEVQLDEAQRASFTVSDHIDNHLDGPFSIQHLGSIEVLAVTQ